MLLAARTEGRDEVFRIYQEPNFLYLTGWSDPDARLLTTPAREILFLPHHNQRRENFMGKRASAEDTDAHAVTGFEDVLPIEKFEAELDQALGANEKVYALQNTPFSDRLKSLYPFRDISDAVPVIAKLRMKKSAAELAAIQHGLETHGSGIIRISAGSDAGKYFSRERVRRRFPCARCWIRSEFHGAALFRQPSARGPGLNSGDRFGGAVRRVCFRHHAYRAGGRQIQPAPARDL